jgi:hypothetical protein
VCENQSNNSSDTEQTKHHTIINRAVENHQWLVTKEVKEKPGDEDDQEDNH